MMNDSGTNIPQRALEDAQRANSRIDGHEAICAERYAGLLNRLTRTEYILYGIVGLLLIGDGTVLEIVKRIAGVK